MINPTLNESTSPRFRELCSQITATMQRLVVPGVVLGVLHGDQEQIAGFGVTSVEHPLPVTAETLFQIGSITKTFLATVVMRLVEKGHLDLDVPVRAYLPDLRMKDECVAARVTMRHLLTHTGGWVGDYFNDFGRGEDALAQMVSQVAELPQLTPLGEIWSYNNSGFYLAGRVIEQVTCKSFEVAMQELLFEPLGLHSTYFFAEDVLTLGFAVGHEVLDGKAAVARPWAIGRAAHPAGGIICSMPDLFRYASFHMGDGLAPSGERLLTPETMTQMHTPLFPANGNRQVCLSWFSVDIAGHKLIGHGGSTKGQITLLNIDPSSQYAAAVFTNCDSGDALCQELIAAAMKAYLGIEEREPTPIELSQPRLSEYLGRYEAAMSICDIRLEQERLILQITEKGGFPAPDSPPSPSPPPMPIAFYAPDRIFILEGPLKGTRGEFLRDGSGKITWLRPGGRVHARLP